MELATIIAFASLMVIVALFLGCVAAVALEQYRERKRERAELEDTLKHMELLK